MPAMDRRRFIAATGGGLAVAVAAGSAVRTATGAEADVIEAGELDLDRRQDTPFCLGVASGDVDSNSVVLWTRLTWEPLEKDLGMGELPKVLEVTWRIAKKRENAKSNATALKHGVDKAKRANGYSVHKVVDKLDAGETYFYQFEWKGHTSPIGRTRTAPKRGTDRPFEFAVADCQSMRNEPHYLGYTDMCKRNIDFVLFIGDYIYENGNGAHVPDAWCKELWQYRVRYGQYKLRNKPLREAHERFPFFMAPDDHEFWNNMWGGALKADPNGDSDRFNAALQAYWENMPMRGGPPTLKKLKLRKKLHREIRWGSLLDLFLLDTRTKREKPGKKATILGRTQRTWLRRRIANSNAKWTVIASQVPVSTLGRPSGGEDKWRGYPRDRGDLISWLANRDPGSKKFNPIIISGDIHCGMATTLTKGNGTPVAAEFLTPAMSSAPTKKDEALASREAAGVWECVTKNGKPFRGYLLCRVRPDKWLADFHGARRLDGPKRKFGLRARWRVVPGKVKAERVRLKRRIANAG